MPFPNWQGGRKKLWTRERVVAALAAAAEELRGPLPCSDRPWNEIKRGRLDWPPAVRIYEFFHSMARAWMAAGAPMKRLNFKNVPWLPEEENYLLDKAGTITLTMIGKRLGRSYGSVKTRLNKEKHVKARDNQGFLSAAEVSTEFQCSYSRVCDYLNEGRIKGRYDKLRHRWQVDPNDLSPTIVAMLTRPRRTHKTWPIDTGNYYKRRGLIRKMIDGHLFVVPKGGDQCQAIIQDTPAAVAGSAT